MNEEKITKPFIDALKNMGKHSSNCSRSLLFTQNYLASSPLLLTNTGSFQLGSDYIVSGCSCKCLSDLRLLTSLNQPLVVANGWGLDAANRLLRVSTTGITFDPRLITGLQVGETLLGLDIRPSTGQLYGLGSTSRLYIINTDTTVATAVGAGFAPPLFGTQFGFDFNPVVDLVRIVSNAGQNLRVSPVTGAVVGVDGTLAYAVGDPNFGQIPAVAGAAYTNSVSPPPLTTTLYVIDTARNVLATQNPPNTGTLNTVGSLGVTVGAVVTFDIQPSTNLGFATLVVGGVAGLYSINLATGAVTSIRTLGGPLSGLALINPSSVPTLVAPSLHVDITVNGVTTRLNGDLSLAQSGFSDPLFRRGVRVCPGDVIRAIATFTAPGFPLGVPVALIGSLTALLTL